MYQDWKIPGRPMQLRQNNPRLIILYSGWDLAGIWLLCGCAEMVSRALAASCNGEQVY